MNYKYNGNGTFTVTKGKMFYYKDWSVFIEPGTKTNFPSFNWFARMFFNPLDFVDEATLHDALVGEFGEPVTMQNVTTGESRPATWKEAAKWFKHELNKNHNRLISQLFYGSVMAWKKVR